MITKVIQITVVAIVVSAGFLSIQNYWPTGGEEPGNVFLFERFRPGDDIVIVSNPADDNRTAWVLNERTSQTTALACTSLQYGALNSDGSFGGGGGTNCQQEFEKGEIYFSDCTHMGYKARGASLGSQDQLATYTPTRPECRQKQKELEKSRREFEDLLRQRRELNEQ